MQAEALIQRIRQAFQHVRQGAVSLSESDVMDCYGSDEERAIARASDTELHWWEISDEKLLKNCYALCFVDAQSWVYLVPAFMVFAIRYGAEELQTVNSMAYDHAVSHLDQLAQELRKVKVKGLEHLHSVPLEESTQNRLEHYRLIDNAQHDVICDFLRFMHEKHKNEVAEEALLLWSTLDRLRV